MAYSNLHKKINELATRTVSGDKASGKTTNSFKSTAAPKATGSGALLLEALKRRQNDTQANLYGGRQSVVSDGYLQAERDSLLNYFNAAGVDPNGARSTGTYSRFINRAAADATPQLNEYQTNRAKLDLVEAEIANRKKLDGVKMESASIRALNDYEQLSKYTAPQEYATDLDKLYSWINDTGYRTQHEMLHGLSAIGKELFTPGLPSVSNLAMIPQSVQSEWKLNGYDLMTEEEIADFNAAYATSPEAAQRYMNSLVNSGVLNRRRAQKQTDFFSDAAENFAEDGGIGGAVGQVGLFGLSVGGNLLSSFTAPQQMADALWGSGDANSYLSDYRRMAESIRSEQGRLAGETWDGEVPIIGGTWGEAVYGLTANLADMLAAYAVGGAFGARGGTADAQKLAQTMTGAIMSSESASSTLYNDLAAGVSPEQATAHALSSAFIEYATEQIPLDNFLKSHASAGKGLVKSFLSEGVEEGVSSISGIIADNFWAKAMQGKSEIMREYDALLLQGYTPEEASNVLWKTTMQSIASDAIMGAVSGGIMGTPGAISDYQSNRAYGKYVQEGNMGDLLMKAAQGMDENTESYKLAKKMKDSGSVASVGRLYRTLVQDLTPQGGKAIDSAYQIKFAQQMRNKGETDEKAMEAAGALVKMLRGDRLTEQEQIALSSSKPAMETVNKIRADAEASTAATTKFDKAYRAGFYGQEATSDMDAAQYQQGVEAARKAEEKRRASIAKGLQLTPGDGSVTYLGEVTSSNQLQGQGKQDFNKMYEGLDKNRKASVDALRELSNAIGLNIVFYKGKASVKGGSITVAEGMYSSGSNNIYIDLNAGLTSDSKRAINSTMLRVAGHEITHFIEHNSAEAYAALREYVKKTMGSKAFDQAVQKAINEHIAQGIDLTMDGAVAEVIADACEMMLKDTSAFQRLATENRSLAEKIVAALKGLLKKIRAAMKNLRPNSAGAIALAESEATLKKLQELWDDALVEAVQNAQGAEISDNISDKTGDNADGLEIQDVPSTSDFMPSDEHPISGNFSLRQLATALDFNLRYTKDGLAPYEMVDSNGNVVTAVTPEQMEQTPMGSLVNAALEAGTINGEVAKAQLKFFSDVANLAIQYKDQATVWEIAGSMLYSAVKDNADKQYSKTVDFGTICAKTQAIIDVMSETMLKLGRGLTREEVIMAYNRTAGNKLSVPCPVCYVFSRWMGVPSLLNSMANYQDRFSSMSAKEVTAYLDGMEQKYGSGEKSTASAINKAKAKIDRQRKKVADALQEALANKTDTAALAKEADRLDAEYADVEAYNWVTQVLCSWKKVGQPLRDSKGTVILDPEYKPVPKEVLFDLRNTGEFAKYAKSWRFRTTRGAGMGKSILPYSGASLGDTVYGQQKRRDKRNNAFLSGKHNNNARRRAIANGVKRMKAQNLIGGHRFQSTSDYRPEWGLDYLMTFLEMQAIGAKGQLYTKVIEAVDLFASANIEVNCSIMPKGNGYRTDANGNPLALSAEDFSSTTGIDFTAAEAMTRKYDNVQMILVGISDAHIRMAMADNRISFIIPWHTSGSNSATLAKLMRSVGETLTNATPYDDTQNDKPVSNPTAAQKAASAVRTKILTGGFLKTEPTDAEWETIDGNEFLTDLYRRFYEDASETETYHVALNSSQASQIFPFEYWDTSLNLDNADENGRRFARYCESLGLTPRFSQFAEDTGYWKLLIDRRMYNRDGSYHHPKVIDVTSVSIGDVATSVSQAKYGDPAKTDAAVKDLINDIKAQEQTQMFPEAVVEESVEDAEALELSDANTQFSIRKEAPPKKTGIAYKVFYQKNGKLYPPMVANPGGEDTPVGVWLNADVGVAAPPSKTGRLQVKAGGKGTQGGSGSLAFRPGWHLGDIPKATQFDRKNPETGARELFPHDFVWAECEYAMDVDYQEEAMSYGYTENGKFRHSYAGLPRLPENGYYRYRTNPDPNTVPWVITGAMKVNRILSRSEVDAILEEKGVEPTKWQGADGKQMQAETEEEQGQFSLRGSSVTQSDVINALKWCSNLLAHHDDTYDEHLVPVRENTPAIILEDLGITDDIPMVMPVRKVRQALAPAGKPFGGSQGHGFSPREMMNILGSISSPEYFSYNNTRKNYGLVVEYKGVGVVVCVAPPRHMNADLLLSEHGGIRAVAVTMFPRRNVEDAITYLERDGYKEKPLPAEAGGDHAPAHTKGVAIKTVPHSGEPVNPSDQFSLRTLSTEELTDEYLASMKPQDFATDVERLFVQRYQVRRKAYLEKLDDVKQAEGLLDKMLERGLKGEAVARQQQRIAGLRRMADRAKEDLDKHLHNKGMRKLYDATAEFVRESIAGKTEEEIAQQIVETEDEVERLNRVADDSDERLVAAKEKLRKLQTNATAKLLEQKTKHDKTVQAEKHARHIKKVVSGLKKLLLHETDYKNVPEKLKLFVGRVVEIMGSDFGSLVFTRQQASDWNSLYAQLKNPEGTYKGLTDYWNEEMQQISEDLVSAAESYESVRSGKGLTSLERAEHRAAILADVDGIVTHVDRVVRKAREDFFADKREGYTETAEELRAQLEKHKDRKELSNEKLAGFVNSLEKLSVTNNLTPEYFFKNLGLPKLYELFQDILLDGQSDYGRIMMEAEQFLADKQREYNYESWADGKELTFTTKQGHKITLDKEQALWMYATWKREHSNTVANTKHLAEGGFIYENSREPDGRKFTAGHKIVDADFMALGKYLTAEQKAYADACVEYLSDVMGAYGNKVSLKLFGIEKYKENYYFPYKTASSKRQQTSTSNTLSTTDDTRMAHPGYAHALTAGARTTLVMGRFTDTMLQHVSEMATYSSFVIPLENMNRVLNYRYIGEDGQETTIRAAIQQKFGDNALGYIETFMRDMNGGVRTEDRSNSGKLVSAYKKTLVAGKLSVALQQISSVPKAFVEVNPKYFTNVVRKNDYRQLMKYSGAAVVKSIGRFDTNVGMTNVEWLASGNYRRASLAEKAKQAVGVRGLKTMGQRWSDITTGLPNKMDEIGWAMIWNAVKKEQAAKNPGMDTKSEAFLQKCGKRFDLVVTRTQVYDSVLSKSQLMRSKGAVDKAMSSFMSESTVTLNMLIDAAQNFQKPGGKKHASAVLSVVTISAVIAAAAQALAGAWNKDDDKRTASEKYMAKFVENTVDNLNPLTMIPGASDLYSILQGYDVERSDTALFADMYQKATSYMGKIQRGENINAWKLVEDSAGMLANMTGIPVGNIMGDMRRFYNALTSDWSAPTATGMALALNPWDDEKVTAVYERLADDILEGDKKMADDATKFLTKVHSKDEKTIAAGVKKDFRERVMDGEVTSTKAISLLNKRYGKLNKFDKDSLYWYFEEAKERAAGNIDEDEDYSKFSDFYAAIDSGNNRSVVSEAKKLLEHGSDKGDLAGRITDRYKPLLKSTMAKNRTAGANLQARILAAYVALGYDRESKLRDIKKWYE